MRRITLRVLAGLACVIALNCGSGPTSPDDPPPVAGGGRGGGGGGAGPTGETAIASDGEFDDSGWDTDVQTFGAGGTGGASHLHYRGQENADYRQITITVNDAGGSTAQVAVFSIKREAAYSPSSDGAIFSIDYSEDSILLSEGSNSQYSAPALKQNGKFYTLVPGGGAFPTPELAWTPHSMTGLTQNDFRTLASPSDHPDFSASGSRIEVGFMRVHSVSPGGGRSTVVGGIDNWRITLRR